MREFVERWSREGERFEEWLDDILKLRERFAELIGARDNGKHGLTMTLEESERLFYENLAVYSIRRAPR